MTDKNEWFHPLLSIDIEAQIQKIANFSLTSAAHYPVELVRLSLKRGADRIEINTTGKKMQIRDNGRGISPPDMARLKALADSSQSLSQREQAIEAFRSQRGIGFLVLFSPALEKTLIENIWGSQPEALLIEQDHIKQSNSRTLELGTRVTILKKQGNYQEEIAILKHYCQGVKKEIIINKTPLTKQSILKECLAVCRMPADGQLGEGLIGVPQAGIICRIWLLDQGIPWFHTAFYPWRGLIFSAAVEYQQEIGPLIYDSCAEQAQQLYQWLTQKYAGLSAKSQTRIEELLFKHYELTSDNQMVNRFSPFRLFQSRQCLNLSQIAEAILTQSLYVIAQKDNPAEFNTSEKTILFLTDPQIDFLLNQAKIPLLFLAPAFNKINRWQRFLFTISQKWTRLLAQFPFSQRKAIAPDHLVPAEALLLKKLQQYLTNQQIKDPAFFPAALTCAFLNSRGFLPTLRVKETIFLRRRHPLVQKAVKIVNAQPDHIEFIAPLLLPE